MPSEPERTCVGCRQRGPKQDLLRVVESSEGIVPDPKASRPGRGAYLHRSPECAGAAIGRGALSRALRVAITAEEASNLLREIERDALVEEGVVDTP